MGPRVSVVVPTRARPDMLPRAVASARAAGRDVDVEVVVVDDASTDATAEVCRSLDDVTYVRLEHNRGVAGARNVGVLASTGSFVAFLDDDDVRLPGSLDAQVAALDAAPDAGLCCGPVVLGGPDGAPVGDVLRPNHPGGDAFWELVSFELPVLALSLLVRREAFFRVGLFADRLAGVDDWDVAVRIAELHAVAVVPEPVGVYRQPGPRSGQGSSRQAAQLTLAARRQRELLRLPRAADAPPERRRRARRVGKDRLAGTLLAAAGRHAAERAYGFAAADIVASIRLAPGRAFRPAAAILSQRAHR